MSFDIRNFESWILDEFEPQMRVDGQRGCYARSVGETEPELYGVADMACILYTLDVLKPDEEERAVWRDCLRSFEQPETGYIAEKRMSHGVMHNTAMALGAMDLLAIRPRYPLHFMEEQRTKEGMIAFMEKLDWEKKVYSGSHDGAGLAAVAVMAPDAVEPEWFTWYFDYCDSLFDPNNGMMGREKPPEGEMDQVGGTFHYHFVYEYFNRRMPYPEARIDSLLGIQQASDRWCGERSWWITLDHLYLMTRTIEHHPYRVDDVREAARQTVGLYVENVNNPEFCAGGWGGDYAVHNVNATISLFAEAQRFLGVEEVVTRRPLQMILDRRPFI